MPIPIDSERLVTFNEAAKFLPVSLRPSHATWWRWWRKGRRGIRLETVVRGGRRLTSIEAVQRFFDKLTTAIPSEPRANSSPQRDRAIDAAERALDAM
jgi:hypothetical protein